jgi:hypothetical protein
MLTIVTAILGVVAFGSCMVGVDLSPRRGWRSHRWPKIIGWLAFGFGCLVLCVHLSARHGR